MRVHTVSYDFFVKNCLGVANTPETRCSGFDKTLWSQSISDVVQVAVLCKKEHCPALRRKKG